LSQGALPVWIKSYRRAGHPEDVEGKDLVILTDVGPVFIQIKSSVNACREYLKKERKFPVGVVLIKSTDPLASVRSNLIAVADRLRRQLIQK